MKRMRHSLPGLQSVLVAAAFLAFPIGAAAQVGNAAQVSVPTLDGFGLASLAGAVAMTGAWLLARGRSTKG